MPPLTGIEVLGTRIEGSVVVIECAFSINLSALTLEQARLSTACASLALCNRARLVPTAGARRLRCWASGARWLRTCASSSQPRRG